MKKLNLLLNFLMFVASIFVGGGAIMAASVITPIAEGGATISEGTGTPPEGAFSKGEERKRRLSYLWLPLTKGLRRSVKCVRL